VSDVNDDDLPLLDYEEEGKSKRRRRRKKRKS
jgi:hypothetical protein